MAEGDDQQRRVSLQQGHQERPGEICQEYTQVRFQSVHFVILTGCCTIPLVSYAVYPFEVLYSELFECWRVINVFWIVYSSADIIVHVCVFAERKSTRERFEIL